MSTKEQENQNEELNKSIDALLDELFVEEENVEKSIDLAGDSKTLADQAVSQAPSSQDDASRGAGRPKQISDVPKVDQDGARAKEYDGAISEQGKEQDQEEADQVKEMNQVKEGGRAGGSAALKTAPFKKSNGEEISDKEWEEFQAFKKSQEEAKVEELKKAKKQEQEDLIKAVVEKTASRYIGEISELKKSLNEQKELVKSFASRPRQSKTITNVEAIEKSFDGGNQPQQESFTKSEMLDAAESLALNKSVQSFNEEHLIELENNGYIYDPVARKTLENFLQNKK